MQLLRLNPILNTDSYKLTHWWQYPPATRHIYSYLESRGGMFEETMLALLQYIIKSNFAGQVFTLDDVEEARREQRGRGHDGCRGRLSEPSREGVERDCG